MEAKMFIANIKLGLVEINATFFFQIFNTLFLIGLIVLVVFFVKFIINNYNNHKKIRTIENKLARVESLLESDQKNDQ
jgi:uncharacterized membrane protein YciS (DUF1049 family)